MAMKLDELVTQLRAAYGATLRSVLLYGSAVAGEHIAKRSDYNVLVILDAVPLDRLAAVGAVLRAWGEAGNPHPMTFTAAEWKSSADVFPMEYADILERHRVLAGTMPMDGLAVRTSDLRLQVEQESLGKLLRLRRATIVAGTDRARQREVLRASLSAFLVVFRGVLRLHGDTPPTDSADVIVQTAMRCGFDATPFSQIHRLVHGGVLADREVDGTMMGYVHGAEALVAYLDQFTPLT